MRKLKLGLLVLVFTLSFLPGTAQAYHPRWSIGINLGVPYYRPYWYPSYGVYYAPAPVIYGTPPIVVQPSPLVVQQPSPVVVPGNTTTATFPPAPTPVPTGNVDFHLQKLSNSDETTRRDSVMELGRLKSERAVEPLTATLAGDKSPPVRDAAARALGLIGSPRALTALIHAAQADPDRDVRHSAQFAVEIIRSNLPR